MKKIGNQHRAFGFAGEIGCQRIVIHDSIGDPDADRVPVFILKAQSVSRIDPVIGPVDQNSLTANHQSLEIEILQHIFVKYGDGLFLFRSRLAGQVFNVCPQVTGIQIDFWNSGSITRIKFKLTLEKIQAEFCPITITVFEFQSEFRGVWEESGPLP